MMLTGRGRDLVRIPATENSPHVRAATGQQINFRRPSIQLAINERQTRCPAQVHFSLGLP
jgi:hypothetical protein